MNTMKDMKLPPKLLYPFVKLGALIFGHFDPDKYSPIESVKKSKLPIIFIHGDVDDFVPTVMSEELYAASSAEHKKLVLIKGAGHGVAFPASEEEYIKALHDFEVECGW